MFVYFLHCYFFLFTDPPSNEMDLWLMKQYPTKCFALALYPKFAYFKANSKPKDVGSDVIIFFQDQKILVQSLRKLKEGQAVGKKQKFNFTKKINKLFFVK